MASLSLYNVYASRSYTAKITCMGNVTIQPTMYFQLRYLPMFNGPYLIINVEHDIRPNTIETSFEGIRVPIPKLPKIDDLVQRVNESLYKEAETNLRETRQPNYYYDNLNATKNQMKLTREQDGYIDSGSTWNSPNLVNDAITWGDVMFPFDVNVSEDNPLEPHLGIDLTPTIKMTDEASSDAGLYVYPAFDGVVTAVVDGCPIGNTEENCAKGNYVEITHDMGIANPLDDETAYYKITYAFLREGVLVTPDQGPESIIYKSSVGVGGKKLGKLGNTGNSKGQHLHFEIVRGVQVKGKIVEHILNPKNFLPAYRPL